jgi:hypothetical protein
MKAARIALVLVATGLVVGGVTAVAQQLDVDENVANIVAVTVALTVVGSVVGWLIGRPEPKLGMTVQAFAVLTAAGVLRHLDAGAVGLVCFGTAWLLAPGAGYVLITMITSGVVPGIKAGARRGRTSVIGLAVLSVAVALTGGHAGPGSRTSVTTMEHLPAISRLLLGLHTVALLLVLGPALRDVRAACRSSWLRTATTLWAAAALVGEAAYLLPRSMVFTTKVGKEGHRDWADGFALRLPLAAALMLVATLLYEYLIRARLVPQGDRLIVRNDNHAPLDARLGSWTGDPTVRVGFLGPDGGWSDRKGRPMASNGSDAQRLTVRLLRAGEPVAIVDHDRRLGEQPGILGFDAGIVGAALDAESDTALASARLVRAQRANARLLRADDDARSALLHDLHAGPIIDLRRIADLAEHGGDLDTIAADLQGIARSVREQSHGLYPPELELGGLAATIGNIVGVPERRLAPSIEVTIFLIVQAAASHGEQDSVTIDDQGALILVTVPGTGEDRLPRDRIEALDGNLTVMGSSVVIELPAAGW